MTESYENERTERYLGSPSTIPYAIIVCENEAVSNARNGTFVKIFKNGVSLNFGRSLKYTVIFQHVTVGAREKYPTDLDLFSIM